MAKQAFQQWYWSDWFGDTNVARLDPASRCVWFELLGIMSQEGTFQVSDDVSSLARATRVRETVMEKALQKIEEKNVAQVIKNNGVYTVISRRLERETISRQQKTERQRRWRDGQRDAGVDADVDVLETSKKHDTRARYSETYKEKYKRKPGCRTPHCSGGGGDRESASAPLRPPCQCTRGHRCGMARGGPGHSAGSGVADAPEPDRRLRRSGPGVAAGRTALYQGGAGVNGCYADDPATWRQGKEAETPFSGNHEVVL